MKTTLAAILWTLVVLAASSDLFSGAHTAFAISFFGVPPEIVQRINFVVRKGAHVTEYAILSWLWFRALRGQASARWAMRWAVLAVVIAACVATIDEVHQSFVPSRTSSPWDVLLDSVGATLAQLVVWWRS